MPRLLACLALLLLSQPGAGQTQPAAVGIITEITKDAAAPTGAITISLSDKTTKTFVVNTATKFEIHRGKEKKRSNFLAEHRGERAAIVLVKGKTDVAARVDILLPAPINPPTHIVHGPPQPGHVRGTITAVDAKSVTMRLHEPPPVHAGVVTDIGFNQDRELGWFAIKTPQNQTEKFVVDSSARFHTVTDSAIVPSNFLAETKGQSVVVFPRSRQHHHVAAKVDIMLGGNAAAAHHARYHPHHHQVTFLLASDTTVTRTRDGRHHPATLMQVLPGEHVSILPTGIHSHIAKNINILLPHAVHGHVTAVSLTALKVKVHHNGNLQNPAHNTEVIIPLAQATVFKTDYKKVVQAAAITALHVGGRVVVYPAGIPPHAAEVVDIHLLPVSAHGKIATAANGILGVMVHHAPKGKPAFHKVEPFQVAAGTKIELHKGRDRIPGSAADLLPGRVVTVHGHTGYPPVAERIEVTVVLPRAVTVRGHLAAAANGVISVAIHHPAAKGMPPHITQEAFTVNAGTRIEIHQGKMNVLGSLASLVPGVEVIVHGHTGTPATASRVEIKLPVPKAAPKFVPKKK